MPKVVTKVRTGGDGLVVEDLSSGKNRSAMSAPDRKFTCIAVVLQVMIRTNWSFLRKDGRLLTYRFPNPQVTRGD